MPRSVVVVSYAQDISGSAGLGGLLERMGVWSFDSFRGVFRWMGVWMDGRVYTALLAFSLATGVGCVALLVRQCRVSRVKVSGGGVSGGGVSGVATLGSSPFAPRFRRWSLALLGLSALLTMGIYVSYNVIFVQPQGRYLFPALPAIALAVALGWEEVVSRPAAARWAGIVLLVTGGMAGLIGLLADRSTNGRWRSSAARALRSSGGRWASPGLGSVAPRVSWLWPLHFPLSRFPCSISSPFPRISYHSWDRPSSTLFCSN